MKWNRGWLALILLPLTLLAAERDWRKVDPFKHNLQEIANACVQAVIDSTMDYVTLGPGDVDSSGWIDVQSLSHAFACYATFVVQLDSGAICAWFTEKYWTGMDQVKHTDSTHVLISRADSLTTTGQWSFDAPFLSGRYIQFYYEALGSDTAGLKPGYQIMR
ncbi:MAG: hypothetical protein PHI18_02005 [bacterium]|nr:hypothetical protein [bacterium]